MVTNEQVQKHFRLVRYLVKKVGKGMDQDDAFQAGALALVDALETFDPKRGKFSTYAGQCIVHAIISERWRSQQTVRMPMHKWKAGARTRTYSLNRPTTPPDDGGDPPEAIDLVTYDHVMLANEHHYAVNIDKLLARFNERTKRMVVQHAVLGMNGGDLAREYGISKQRAGTVVREAYERLRKELA